jgi:hypothetical protein
MGKHLIEYLYSDTVSCEVKPGGGGSSIISTNQGINSPLHKSHILTNRSNENIIWMDAGVCDIHSYSAPVNGCCHCDAGMINVHIYVIYLRNETYKNIGD